MKNINLEMNVYSFNVKDELRDECILIQCKEYTYPMKSINLEIKLNLSNEKYKFRDEIKLI
jgi:hypothetical protein